MRNRGRLILAGACVTILGSCAPAASNGVYEQWGAILSRGSAGGATHTIDDVSLLVGETPTRCDTVVGPTRDLGFAALGIGIHSSGGVIAWIVPGSLADSSHVPDHGVIVAVDGKRSTGTTIDTTKDGIITRAGMTADAHVSVGVPVTLEFADSQKITMTLHSAQWLQCYWHVGAGRIAHSEGEASVNASSGFVGSSGSGSARGSGVAYDRYFIVSARFVNGAMTQSSSNWQGE